MGLNSFWCTWQYCINYVNKKKKLKKGREKENRFCMSALRDILINLGVYSVKYKVHSMAGG